MFIRVINDTAELFDEYGRAASHAAEHRYLAALRELNKPEAEHWLSVGFALARERRQRAERDLP